LLGGEQGSRQPSSGVNAQGLAISVSPATRGGRSTSGRLFTGGSYWHGFFDGTLEVGSLLEEVLKGLASIRRPGCRSLSFHRQSRGV